jgi:hypothetical protein
MRPPSPSCSMLLKFKRRLRNSGKLLFVTTIVATSNVAISLLTQLCRVFAMAIMAMAPLGAWCVVPPEFRFRWWGRSVVGVIVLGWAVGARPSPSAGGSGRARRGSGGATHTHTHTYGYFSVSTACSMR